MNEQAEALEEHIQTASQDKQEFARMRVIVEGLQITTRETHIIVGEVRETMAEMRGMLAGRLREK